MHVAARSDVGMVRSGNEDSFFAHEFRFAAGAGVRPGIAVPLTRQIDIAPTVARLLGFELTDADGVPLVGILGSGTAARRDAGGY